MKIAGIILLMTGLIGFSFNTNLQSDSADCNTYFPLTIGMEWTMESKDKKGKLVGSNTIKVLDAKPADGGLIYVMQGLLSDEKGEEIKRTDFEYQCVKGTLKLSMKDLVPESILENESMTITVDTDGMEIPSSLAEGQKLKDAKIHVIGKIETIKAFDMTVVVSDRLVEKFEEVTTKAGTFNCAKITSKSKIKMGFISETTSSIQWISKDVGIVKTEDYDKKGKFDGSTELVEFKK